MKKLAAFLITIMLIFSLLPVSVLAEGPVTNINVTSAGDATNVHVGGTLQMLAEVSPGEATDKSVTWSVTNGTGEATITGDGGLLTGVSAGTVTVRAAANDGSGISGEKEIMVTTPASGITISSSGGVTSLHVDESVQMEATVSPEDASNKSVAWSITNHTGRATIDQSGLLTGVEEGTITVRATAKDSSGVYGETQFTVLQKPGHFTVRFDLNGAEGIVPAVQNVANGGKVTRPADPVRTNYAFKGWYKEAACRHAWSFTRDTVKGSLTLYAKWVQTAFPYQLTGIHYTAGRMKGTFRPSAYSYTIYLAENEGDITVTPIQAFPGSTMTIDGEGITSKSIHVDNGRSARMYIRVSGGNRTRTYTLSIKRAACTNNTLESLTSSGAPLEPTFNGGYTDYTVTLPEKVDRTTLTAAAVYPALTRVYYTSRTYILKNNETRRVTVRVRSQAGKYRYYHVVIHRLPSTNTNLASIGTSSVFCPLKEPFSPETTAYTVTMASNIPSITFSSKAEDRLSRVTTRVTIDGVARTTSRVSLLNGQSAKVEVTVTAQSKATKTYTITVNRLKVPIDNSSPYYIYVEKGGHSLTVFGKDENGEYTKFIRTFVTGIGKASTPTPAGLFRISKKERWHRFNSTQVVQYACTYTSGLFIHSPVYSEMKIDTMVPRYYTEIGYDKTHGCLRMTTGASYWIYMNCPVGTYVEIVSGAPKGYTGEPIPPIDPAYPRVDPTDPEFIVKS